jgi:hypothetical protein
MSDQDIIQDFDQCYEWAYACWNAFFPLAERDLRFYLGDQWSNEEKRELFLQNRNQFVFNRIRRNINMVSGYQRKNRLSSVVSPVENSDQLTADQLSKLLLFVMQANDGYNIISDCFAGALKTGWNMASLWVDYRDDPVNGDIKLRRECYNNFITDPYFTNMDLSDCEYIQRRKYLNYQQVQSLLPEHKKEVYEMYRIGWERDDKFTWLPYQRNPGGQTMMAYNEFYRQRWKDVPVLVDTETGEMIEFDLPKEDIDFFMSQYPQLKMISRQKRYIEMNIILNGKVMKTEENPFGLDEYPFVPFYAIWEPESDEWGLKIQSLTRCMIDPQREANRRRSQMIDIIDSQINSGWIAKENSVINPNSLFQTSQGKVVWKREDAQPDALEKIPPAQIPPSTFQLQELFDKDMMEICGLNDSAFGVAENANDSGVMMMLRQGSTITNLQDVMDYLRLSQKSLSKKVVKLIQTWTASKVKRIINEEPSQQFYSKDFTKYDITIQEGLLTDSQRQIYFRQLVDLKQLGVPVTGEMLAKAAPIQGKSEFNAEIAEQEKQMAQQAQQAQQVQQQQMQMQAQAFQAKAISDIALSKERFTRSIANMGLSEERAAEAIQNRAQASLDRARTMKELESMDDDRIMKFAQIVQMFNDMNKKEEQESKAEDIMVTEQSEKLNSAFPQPEAMPNSPELQASNIPGV